MFLTDIVFLLIIVNSYTYNSIQVIVALKPSKKLKCKYLECNYDHTYFPIFCYDQDNMKHVLGNVIRNVADNTHVHLYLKPAFASNNFFIFKYWKLKTCISENSLLAKE